LQVVDVLPTSHVLDGVSRFGQAGEETGQTRMVLEKWGQIKRGLVHANTAEKTME
jgi:hypothetical protein